MFDNIQLAFFDYDRTLYSHEYPVCGVHHPSYYDECVTHLLRSTQEKAQERDKPLKCMQWCVTLLQENKVPIYVLTHEIFNLRDEWKKMTAERDYGITNYLTVNEPNNKIEMIKAVATISNVPLRNCLFVDDRMDVIYLACDEGIFGLHTSNISQMYEDIETSK